MTQTGTAAKTTAADAQYILTQVTDEGLCERIIKRVRVTEAECTAVRQAWRAEMRDNPARSSDRIHCREA